MSQQDHKDFFISYNGADQRWAEWIAWQLEEASYSVILQAWDFLPGSNFVVQMDRALTLAPRMIAVLSPQYLSALYTQPEWAAAFRRDPKGERSLLIPVRVQACEVTGLLGPIVYVDLVGQDEATARQRLLAGARHERAKPAQAPAFPQTIQHTISKQLNFPGDLPPIWKMPHQRDPLFLGREQLLRELHTTLATDHKVLLFEPAGEREIGMSGATETAVEYAYRYRSDYQVIAWIQAHSREALQSDLLSLAAALHLPQTNPADQDPLTAVVQWLRTHQHWLLVLDQAQEKEVLAPLMPLPEQGHLLVVTSTRSLESLAPLLELGQVPWEERTVLTQLSQVVGAALQGPQGRVPLGLEPITIGRASTNQVILSDLSVSSHHAIIALKDQAYWITDRGSTNGTLLNQQRLVPQVPSRLHPGDTIRLGNITCIYEVLDRPSRSLVSPPSSEQGNTSAGAYPPSSPAIERPRQDRVGQRFGNYRLSRLLGQGGFAEVYLGVHIFLDTQTAIKVLYTQLVGQDVEQFRQEARTIALLEHPHIVRLLDFGVEATTPYLIMSYAPNGTMRQRYPRGTRLPLELVVSYVKQIAQALQYAHDHKVIHRDIKPENMLFGPDDQVVLSDFGIATIVHSTTSLSVQAAIGTVHYMAPEQLQERPRPASDQYALGVVLYEWLCGDRPFNGSLTEVVVKHLTMPPPPLRGRVPTISAEIEQVVMTALAKDYKQRFGSMQAFAHALEQASQLALSHSVLPPTEIKLPSQLVPPAAPSAANWPSQTAHTTEIDTSATPSGVPTKMDTSASPVAEPMEAITPAGQPSLPTEMVASPGEGSPPTVADTAPHTSAVSHPPMREPVAPGELQPTKRGVSRRTVVLGLAGLAAASAGVAWLVVSRPSSHPSGNASSSGGSTGVTSVNVLAVWSGVELTNFQLINAAFTKKTGIKVNVESTGDLPTVLTTRISENNPPDVTSSPGLAQLHTLISQGKVIRLDTFLDMNQIRHDYSQDWINLASYNGGLYAVLPKANSKGTIWYDPKQFTANGYTIPQTWNDLIALSDKIASSGKYPWSMGVASGSASGWPGADWIDQIYLSLNGPDMVDMWVNHKIKWTDPSVKNAFQMFGEIVQGTHYINGAPQSILATGFQDASYLPYDTPPKAYMNYLGDFTVGFITAQFPSLQAGTDYNFFPFPTITPAYAGAVTGGADFLVALRDNSAVRQYMQYLSTAEAQEIWVRQGGASSLNKGVPLSAYPNDVQRAAGKQLSQATSFRVGADDLMPQAMESAYWKGVLDYISNPSQLNSILSTLESTAVSAYSS